MLLALACEAPPAADPGSLPPEPVVPELAWRTADQAGGGVDFGSVRSLAVSSAAEVYVADDRAAEIVVLDPAGGLLRRLGRRGEGPGEFRALVALGFAGDTLRAFDAALSRMTSFLSADSVARVDPVPAEEQFGQPADFAFGPDGVLHHVGYARFQASLVPGLAGRRTGLVRGTVTAERWAPGDTGWTVTLEAPGLEVFVDLDEGRLADPWFAARLLRAPAPGGGVWTGDSRTGRLERWSADGARLAEARVPLAPAPVTDGDRAAFADAADIDDAARRAPVRNRRRGIPLPATRPVLRSLLAAPFGGVLAGENLATDHPAGPHGQPATLRRWFEFDAAGRHVRTLALPAGVEPLAAATDELWAVARDSLDVPRIEMWSLRPPRLASPGR